VSRRLLCSPRPASSLTAVAFGRDMVSKFIHEPTVRRLVVVVTNGSLDVSLQLPTRFDKGVFFVKKEPVAITSANIFHVTLCGDMSSGCVEQLSTLLDAVFLPLLQNEYTMHKWPLTVKQTLMKSFHELSGQVHVIKGRENGHMFLPVKYTEAACECVSTRDKVHTLESAVADWMSQVRALLATQSNQAAATGSTERPGAKVELEFWKSRSSNLRLLNDQLNDAQCEAILKLLRESESSYLSSMLQTMQDVAVGLEEAHDIVRFLDALRGPLDEMLDAPFESVTQTLAPLMHVVSLIWSFSRHYNHPKRIVTLMSHLCNDLMLCASNYINAEELFTLSPNDAMRRLKKARAVCLAFKRLFLESKARVRMIRKNDRNWRVESSQIFGQIDTFASRCYDALALVETKLSFSSLSAIYIGGTSGKTLTQQIYEVHSEYEQAALRIREAPSTVFQLDTPDFDNAFSLFRIRIKELEGQLASVIKLGFGECVTVLAAIKLLDSFGDLLQQPLVMEKVELSFLQLVANQSAELRHLTTEFHEGSGSPSRSRNMPPVAGSITWSRSLVHRIMTPVAPLQALPLRIRESPEYVEMNGQQEALLSAIYDWELEKIREWNHGVDEALTVKLRQSLLKREAEAGFIALNFDPAVTAVLRECKYLLLLEVDVPENAMSIYTQGEAYRIYTVKLTAVVDMYNEMKQNLLAVEEPLLDDRWGELDATIDKGVGSLTWKSHGIADYIGRLYTTTKTLYDMVSTMKNHVQRIRNIFESWSKASLFTKPENRPVVDVDSVNEQITTFLRECDEGATDIQGTFDNTQELLGITSATPGWRGYVEYMSQVVAQGLVQTVRSHLSLLHDELDGSPARDEFMETRIELSSNGSQVVYVPGIDGQSPGLHTIILAWLQSLCQLGESIPRLDGPGTYTLEVAEDTMVRNKVASIERQLRLIIGGLDTFREKLACYSFLWEQNPHEYLEKFLLSKRAGNKSPDAMHAPLGPGIPVLEDFEVEIEAYKELHYEITNNDSWNTVSWIRVDMRVIKHQLGALALKWRGTFTKHLTDKMSQGLSDMAELMQTTRDAFSSVEKLEHGWDITKSEATYILDNTMLCLHAFEQHSEYDSVSTPIEKCILLLRRYNVDIPNEITVGLDSNPKQWVALQEASEQVQEKVAPFLTDARNAMQHEEDDFKRTVARFVIAFQGSVAFKWDASGPFQAYAALNTSYAELMKLELEAEEMSAKERMLGLPALTFTDSLTQCGIDVLVLKQVWDTVAVVLAQLQAWRRTRLTTVDMTAVMMRTKEMEQELQHIDVAAHKWPVYQELVDHTRNFANSLPLVDELRNDAMRDRHWAELMKVTRKKFVITEDFTLGDILQLNLHTTAREVRDIVQQAIKDFGVEKFLAKLEASWKDVNFAFGLHVKKSVPLLKPVDRIRDVLEEGQVGLQTIGGGKGIPHFEDQISEWMTALTTIETVLALWTEVQKSWCSLENIFTSSKDIRSQLPKETKLFDGAEVEWKEMMTNVADGMMTVRETCTVGFVHKLDRIQSTLNVCQHALASYVETKRQAFPRLYFVSYTDILDLLSKGNSPFEVVTHLSKLFDNVQRLMFNPIDLDGPADLGNVVLQKVHAEETAHTDLPRKAGWSRNARKVVVSAAQMADEYRKLTPEEMAKRFTTEAIGMFSDEGEYMSFGEHACDCVGVVESWLARLLTTTLDAVNASIDSAVSTMPDKPRVEWLFDHCAQPVLLSSQIYFANEVNAAFENIDSGDEGSLRRTLDQHTDHVASLIRLIQDSAPSATDRRKVMTLLTFDIHGRDVLTDLVEQGENIASCFAWQGQLRSFWDDDTRTCQVEVADASFAYSNEYLGNTPRLVITPLTDKCYVTLTQALKLHMGGAPAGPAGTGKTETTKDLGRALGKAVYVFNCSDQMDYRSIGNIFKGLTMSGTWGCFDEFNRISVDVLSVVSTQFLSIIQSISAGRKRFVFMGEDILIDHTCGVFITMNPGYAGRSQLPESLKALFRPVSMVVPDLALICENMLVSQGFTTAKSLASKFTQLYALSASLLSAAEHYDWGLRAIKSVLVVAGKLKSQAGKAPEASVLMGALRDFNLSRITTLDRPVFLGLLRDLFPSVAYGQRPPHSLRRVGAEAAKELGLQGEEHFLDKVTQLYEIMQVRHSVFLVGASGVGKTRVRETLGKALTTEEGRKCTTRILNPKAISTDELYGYIHPVSREWKDGLLSRFMRDLASAVTNDMQWIVLDGHIDPVWIESLNTVMDDNKVLTLASNERIVLTPTMSMMFETDNLRSATPATVSRAGVLFLESVELGWQASMNSWVERIENQRAKSLFGVFFNTYSNPTLEFVTRNMQCPMESSEFVMVQQVRYLLDTLLEVYRVKLAASQEKSIFERLFVFAFIWGVGSTFDSARDGRAKLNSWWRKTFTEIEFPDVGTVFDYCLNTEVTGFVPWKSLVPAHVSVEVADLKSLLVPTPETTALAYFMQHVAKTNHSIMLIGQAGCGKTVLAKYVLDVLSETFSHSTVAFNYCLTSTQLQGRLESVLEKKAGRTYGPKGSSRLIYFLDDMQCSAVDEYGSQPPLELLVQHLSHQYWYNRDKLNKVEVERVQYISCANVWNGRHRMNRRLARHFVTLQLEPASAESMEIMIYNHVLGGHFKGEFGKSVTELVPRLVRGTIVLHTRLCRQLIPTLRTFHYCFTQHDVAAVFSGLLLAEPLYFRDGNKLGRLWVHEMRRVYGDRLVCSEDSMLFDKLLRDVAGNSLVGIREEELFRKPLLYCAMPSGGEDASYNEISDYGRLHEAMEAGLARYNSSGAAAMDLVLFEDAMDHVTRIMRVLKMRKGHLMLVGVGGSGKQSLSRLSAHLLGVLHIQLQLGRSDYTYLNFVDDLRAIYTTVGIKGTETMLLINEAKLSDTSFLADINDLVASADILAILTPEDRDDIIKVLSNELKMQGLMNTPDDCMRYFKDRVLNGLHVVFCVSPVGENLRIHCRHFPSLLGGMGMDWVHPWPKGGLQTVADKFLCDFECGSAEESHFVTTFVATVHQDVGKQCAVYNQEEGRHCYVTPKTFLELLETVQKLCAKSRADLDQATGRLNAGLLQLKTANDSVTQLRDDLEKQQVVVAEKELVADNLLSELSVESAQVETERKSASEEREHCKRLTKEVDTNREQCLSELARAEPAIVAAEEALNSLDKNSLTELRSLGSPPDLVKACLSAVLILTMSTKSGIPKDISWDAAKKAMKNVDKFRTTLVEFKEAVVETTGIPDVAMRALMSYLENSEFDPTAIQAKSKAAGGICGWVINIVRYYHIFQEVQPKRKALSDANNSLDRAKAELEDARDRVVKLETKLQTLKDGFETASEAKAGAIAQAKRMQDRLNMTDRLMSGFAGEASRWANDVSRLDARKASAVGDALLAACFISYAGCFDTRVRHRMISNSWVPSLDANLAMSKELIEAGPLAYLVTDTEVGAWNNEGLPNDTFSIENAAILKSSGRCPLLVDPQEQAIRWVKNHGHGGEFHSIRCGHKTCMRIVEHAIQAGEIVLVEDVTETLPPDLEAVLQKSLIRVGEDLTLDMNGRRIQYDPKFKLILHTSMGNPHFKPEIQAQTVLINFSLTHQGLQEQLVNLVMEKEHPTLAELRVTIMRERNECQVQLKQLEDDLLFQLSTVSGDILSNTELIQSLEATKATAVKIAEQVDAGAQTKQSVEETRILYTGVGKRGSLLFFVINSLYTMNDVYRYSLKSFLGIIERALSSVEKVPQQDRIELGKEEEGDGKEAGGTSRHVEALVDAVTLRSFEYVARGLYEEHKLVFTVQMCFSVLSDTGKVPAKELRALLQWRKTAAPEGCEQPRWRCGCRILAHAKVQSHVATSNLQSSAGRGV